MLRELNVENLALIESASLHFSNGFSALSGETGAGKSLLIDALQLALGDRADTSQIRTGSKKATVHAVFDLTQHPNLQQLAAELGLELEDGLLYVQREVLAEGRSQCRVGGKPVPAANLKQLGQQMVDLHGQHEHQMLLNPEFHGKYLDTWIGEECETLLQTVQSLYQERSELQRKLQDIRRNIQTREQRIDILQFQIEEITDAAPQPGELAQVESTVARLTNLEKIAQAILISKEALLESEQSATSLMGTALKNLETAHKHDEALAPTLEALQNSIEYLDQTLMELRAYEETLEVSPSALEEALDRLETLRKLVRKYGESDAEDPISSVLNYLNNAQAELETLLDTQMSEESLVAQIEEVNTKLQEAAQALSDLRKTKAPLFTESVLSHLRDLAMGNARLTMQIEEKPIAEDGLDAIEFLFSANLGEPEKPLAKIASGGELSRVMLALKATLAGKAGTPTMVFDEVDSGLSGKAAALVAKKIEELAQYTQILVISHLPQMAARAKHHYRIYKEEVEGRSRTITEQLTLEQRVEEVARMIAGENITESARTSALELLGSTS